MRSTRRWRRVRSWRLSAGVGKATIYRHWQGKLDLVGDALETLRRPVAPPADGPTRERIVALLEALVSTLGESPWSKCMPALIDAAARDETVRAFHHQFVAAPARSWWI